MSVDWNLVMACLGIMVKGMIGIFIVILVIFLTMFVVRFVPYLINKKKKGRNHI